MLKRIEVLLERNRDKSQPPSQQEIDDVYTDACATILTLESQRAVADRELAGLLSAGSDHPAQVKAAREAARRRHGVEADLLALRALAASLSTAAEWSRDPLSHDVRHLMR